MTGWHELTLGDALQVVHGYAFKGRYFAAEGDLVVLTPANFFKDGGFKLKGAEKYYIGPVPDGYLLDRGDVVVAMTQAAELLGSSATIPQNNRYLHNQRIGLIRITDPSELDLRFCYHLMNSPRVREQIQATATGFTVRHTAPERVQSVRVAVPSIERQRAIAGILDAVEDAIESCGRRIQILESIAGAIYSEWFVHFRYPGHDFENLIDSPVGPIPSGWSLRPLFDVVDVGFGYSFKSRLFGDTGAYPVIRIRNIPLGETHTFTDEKAPERCRVRDGDVLIGMDGDFHMCQWSSGDAWLNQRVARLRPTISMAPRHLLLAIKEPITRWNEAIVGTTVAHLGKSHMEQIQLVVPSEQVLGMASTAFDNLGGMVAILEKLRRTLITLRRLLLPRLIAGEIDVASFDDVALCRLSA